MKLEIYNTDDDLTEFTNREKKRDRIFGLSLLTLGLLSLSFAVLPIILWQLVTAPYLSAKIKDFPIPNGQVLSETSAYLDSIQIAQDKDGFSYFTTSYRPKGTGPKEFFVSIPKLEIVNARAKVDSLDFYNSLSHFPGTALPGELGNVFITGHSVLPQFSHPDDYYGIFSKLPELEAGDIISIRLDSKTYQYVVQYKKIVEPKDLSVLKPISKNAKNLTLMTCVPPGTSLKRMVVITSLI